VAERTELRVATRKSALARWQADHVAGLLGRGAGDQGTAVHVELVLVETSADRRHDVAIWEMGGKGVFVKEVQAAVLDGRADLAVHSAKDLPSVAHRQLVIGAVPSRADARDLLVGATVDGLAPGAVVATGSVRRRAQLADLRPDLTFVGLRGNIGTRLEKIPDGGAIVMAAAAVDRLGLSLDDHEHEVLPVSVMVPQVGQGALAVECRGDAERVRSLLAAIDDERSHAALDAERAFLAELGGDCDLPAGAHATRVGAGWAVEGLLASLDGHVVLRHRIVGDDPGDVGRAVARHLLDGAGGRELLLAS
jgi:hydroxymethylbilane synthase